MGVSKERRNAFLNNKRNAITDTIGAGYEIRVMIELKYRI